MVHVLLFLYNYIEVRTVARWEYYNANPRGRRTGDCVIRAVCAATGKSWDEVYTSVALLAYALEDMPSTNHVWRTCLKSMGYKRATIPDTCPDCYTVEDFADEHQSGSYVVGTGTHAVAVVDGTVLDTWDSRDEVPLYYYYKER